MKKSAVGYVFWGNHNITAVNHCQYAFRFRDRGWAKNFPYPIRIRQKGDKKREETNGRMGRHSKDATCLKGMDYRDLSEQTGITIDCIKQVMTKDNQPRHRKTICEFVGIPDPGEAQN